MATIRKRKNGNWQVLIRKKNYPNVVKTFLDKTSANKYARMIESQMDRSVFTDMSGAEGTTLRELIIKYRDEIVPELKSARTLTYKLNHILKYKISYYNLLQLNSSHIYTFKKEISEGRAPKTINGYIQTLRTIWNIAQKQWAIVLPPQSPFALITFDKVNNERDITLTDEEFQRLLNEADKIYKKTPWKKQKLEKINMLPDMIKFAAITAARFSEIRNLKRSDVDFNKKTATFRDTKNGKTHTIPLAEDAIVILRRNPFGDNFFYINSREEFRNYYDQARNNAGLPEFRFHDLRSFAIRRMLLSGMSAIEVAAVSNHKTLSILHRRYSRLKPADLLDKVNQAGKIS